MDSTIKKAMRVITGLYVAGVICLWIGIAYGEDMGSYFSRPRGASRWSVSNGLVNACTYVPVIIGLSLMVMAIIFCIQVFNEWLNK